MKKSLVLSAIFFTIFLDFFNLGLIYPIFTSLVFEGSGEIIRLNASDFYKNTAFGFLIAAFPFGQFLGAPLIGHLSDQYGRRKLLIISLIGTVATLLICVGGVLLSSFYLLILGRFAGGLMAGNMTLAYASLADFSSQEDKVKNFALIPLAIGLGFGLGPYLAGILANPNTHSLAGPALPFLAAVLLALTNLVLVVWKFPETGTAKHHNGNLTASFLQGMTRLGKALRLKALRPYLWVLFLMLSSNLVFVQFVGPFAIERFGFDVTQVGYLYANIGISVAIGHAFFTRRLASRYTPEQALIWSLVALGVLIVCILLSPTALVLHIVTFFVMIACAVAYTNSMALVSNQAAKDQQGEVMGVAVSIQSCAEFLPAMILGFLAFITQILPLFIAALFAGCGGYILRALMKKASQESQVS